MQGFFKNEDDEEIQIEVSIKGEDATYEDISLQSTGK